MAAGAAYLAGRDFTRVFALPVSLGFVIMKSLWWRLLGQGWNTRGSTLWLNATELFNPNSETNVRQQSKYVTRMVAGVPAPNKRSLISKYVATKIKWCNVRITPQQSNKLYLKEIGGPQTRLFLHHRLVRLLGVATHNTKKKNKNNQGGINKVAFCLWRR